MRVGPASIRMPAPTIRLRLTAMYGLVFLVTGAVLLTIGYELVHHNVNPTATCNELRKAGFAPRFCRRPLGSGSSPEARFIYAYLVQLRSDELHRLLIE